MAIFIDSFSFGWGSNTSWLTDISHTSKWFFNIKAALVRLFGPDCSGTSYAVEHLQIFLLLLVLEHKFTECYLQVIKWFKAMTFWMDQIEVCG